MCMYEVCIMYVYEVCICMCMRCVYMYVLNNFYKDFANC